MYLMRRIWKCKPGEARRVASMVHKQATIYREAGQRSEFQRLLSMAQQPRPTPILLFWNGPTKPLMSTMRAGNELPQAALAVGAQVRELTEGNHLEVMELMTPDKMLDA